MPSTTLLLRWLTPVAFLVAGALLGWIVDRLVFANLRRLAKRTNWGIDDLLLRGLGHMAVLWGLLSGAYLATYNLPFAVTPGALALTRNIMFVVAAFSVIVVVARLAVSGVHLYAARVEGALPSVSIFTNLLSLIVYLLGGMIILQSLGISITPVLTALGVGGLAVALALQDTLSNLFSGFQILASRHVRPGDFVKLDSGEEGYVHDITWRITTIESFYEHYLVMVPNAKLAQAIVTNYHQPTGDMAVIVPVGVSYDSDLEKVERVTIAVGRAVQQEVEGAVRDWTPVVRFHTFNDSSIDFNVVLRSGAYGDKFRLQHEFVKRLHRRYNDESIEIPFPIRTVVMKNRSTGD